MQDDPNVLSRPEALSLLGVSSTATEAEVMMAYKAQSGPLKRALTSAATVGEKDRYRTLLRRCVRARDTVLGRKSRPEPQFTIAVDTILGALSNLSFRGLDRAGALRAMGLGPDGTDDQVRTAFAERYRALTRSLAASADAREMYQLQEARLKMRRLSAELTAHGAERTDEAPGDPTPAELPGETDDLVVEEDARPPPVFGPEPGTREDRGSADPPLPRAVDLDATLTDDNIDTYFPNDGRDSRDGTD
ncbi:MAG: hypothetical protein V3T86_00900 [Planctomycetota bacterium]